jgi:bleomycin hydrolase
MKKTIILALLLFCISYTYTQEPKETTDSKQGYQFEMIKKLPATPVPDQFRSGTCWSFSGISFLESELIRKGKGEFNLSEMFIVRQAYSDKAKLTVRMHGNLNFGPGGAFHDVTSMWKKYGIVPEEAYNGLVIGEEKHIHGEMDEVLKSYVDGVIKNKNKKLTPVWHKGFEGLLNAYLGPYPEKFTYKGKEYTPASFAKELNLNMDDYIEITSYTHHPFYEKFIIEVPDNWMMSSVYNVPLDELIEIIDYSLENGYTVAWASDVSEKGFAYRNGVAVVPTVNTEEMNNAEILKWQEMSEKEKEAALYKFDKPGAEKAITQEIRQEAFDNFETTDDHGMHIIGTAKDQNGTRYYYVKNSWADSNLYEGFFYASVPFVRYKTLSIMVHKDSVPKKIKSKLNI